MISQSPFERTSPSQQAHLIISSLISKHGVIEAIGNMIYRDHGMDEGVRVVFADGHNVDIAFGFTPEHGLEGAHIIAEWDNENGEGN